jgi:predicted amidohydrolase YtcJ
MPIAKLLVLLILPLLLAAGLHAAPPEGVTVYTSGRIYTVDPTAPRAEALAVQDGRILWIGSDAEVRRAAGEGAELVDLEGRTVLPGLIDAHGHIAGLGAFGLGVIDLSATKSFDEVVRAAAAAARGKAAGEWVLGGRWDHESWPERELPSHEALSAAAPDHLVWLRRVDGHAGIANRRALELAGITKETPNPDGGEILRDANGEATGVLIDNAMSLIEAKIPAGARGTGRELVLRAQELCLAAGLTGVHDAGISPADIALYRELEREGVLKLRINAMLAAFHAMRWFEQNSPIIPDRASAPRARLTVRSTKLYMDGAMGSRGAWLLEPYADRKVGLDGEPYTGLAVNKPEFIEAVARHALRRGYQVCTHAIGDRANREVLDAYQRAIEDWRENNPGESPEHRFRIEHAQLLSPEDLPRFARLGVIASMQPTHATSDMRWVEDRVGIERARGAYAWASLLRSGAVVAAGSDFPVESHNPFLGFYAAITRQTVAGQPEGGWMPQERMTREDALRAMTLDAAMASFEEEQRGSLEIGKIADFIVIDRDVMTCDPAEIPGTRVLLTVIGGEVAYRSPEADGDR